MNVGDRVSYRGGTAASEIGTVTAVTPTQDDKTVIEILLDTGAHIKVGAAHDWATLPAQQAN